MGIIPIRPLVVDGDIAMVPLSMGLFALIDATDAALVGRYNWCARRDKKGSYALRAQKIDGKKNYIYLHRWIMAPASGLVVDHKNRDGLDNRRSNLRVCTLSQNNSNKIASRTNTSGVKGVTWCKISNKWKAQISINGQYRYLGSSNSLEEAAQLYGDAAEKLHGQFARAE